MSTNRLVNFNIGFELIEGFNRGMRDYQIDLMGPYKDQRLDIYFVIRTYWFNSSLRKEQAFLISTVMLILFSIYDGSLNNLIFHAMFLKNLRSNYCPFYCRISGH